MISKKICLIGDFNVGKTSLVRRFVEGQFSDVYKSTVGVKISRKLMNASNIPDRQVQLIIWDIEGQTRFKAIAPNYLQGATASIIVGDLTRPFTIDNITEHIALYNSINPNGLSIIALNKSDLAPEERSLKIAQVYQFNHYPQVISTYLTSAKEGNCVERMFQELADRILERTNEL
jgi:small GTP-binding protein